MKQQRMEVNVQSRLLAWRNDWNLFIKEAFGVSLDKDQQAIVSAVQHNKRVSVRSGTARGKDYVSACISLCFLYLTPVWNSKGELISNTKVAMTAPTARQVENIMMAEVSRLYERAKARGFLLPGKLNSDGIRMNNKEWFLVGFKADEHNHEAWSGFHAANTMFVVTEATGVADDTFEAIEGNLQGNSRILLVFNPNVTTGYAAKSQKQERYKRFCLNSLTAPNVVAKKTIHIGQVDYDWVADKVENWCSPIAEDERKESENDFQWEDRWYRPSDLFRRKVLGEFPKVGEDSLIPQKWIELANERWNEHHAEYVTCGGVLGVDVAGMGRDASCFVDRYDNYVDTIVKRNSAGKADHMAVAGYAINYLQHHTACAVSIDTIGEGAGVFSRCVEVGETAHDVDEGAVFSCKYSEGATKLHDVTGQYEFVNMRAYLFWCVRDWLNPDNNNNAMLPPNDELMQEATEIKYSFHSNGKIIIEPKEDIKNRLGRSTDVFDALANTFYPKAAKYASWANLGANNNTDEDDIEDILY